ncbi:hypothetical protein G6F66_015703 [Rhizopus arrhizus]|nr:hypothetical protein G6F66_015703 [Rhizopus arrhizus]
MADRGVRHLQRTALPRPAVPAGAGPAGKGLLPEVAAGRHGAAAVHLVRGGAAGAVELPRRGRQHAGYRR